LLGSASILCAVVSADDVTRNAELAAPERSRGASVVTSTDAWAGSVTARASALSRFSDLQTRSASITGTTVRDGQTDPVGKFLECPPRRLVG
jgi:hypothetical protein